MRLGPHWRAEQKYTFSIPAVPGTLRLHSRAAAPDELGLKRDPRRLGVSVRQLAIRQGTRFQVIKSPNSRLIDGFHDFEPREGVRWTDGNARLPASLFTGMRGAFELVVDLGGATQYPDVQIGNAGSPITVTTPRITRSRRYGRKAQDEP